MWKFGSRMELGRKEFSQHITVAVKPEEIALRETPQWKVNDLKAFAILSKRMDPTYQSMVRDAASTLEACEILRAFFVKQSVHNRVQLRKQLHEFSMSPGLNLMEHGIRRAMLPSGRGW
jgi:hypothetical protein